MDRLGAANPTESDDFGSNASKRVVHLERQKAELEARCLSLFKELTETRSALANERSRAQAAAERLFAEARTKSIQGKTMEKENAMLREEVSGLRRALAMKLDSQDGGRTLAETLLGRQEREIEFQSMQQRIEMLQKQLADLQIVMETRALTASKSLLSLEESNQIERFRVGMLVSNVLAELPIDTRSLRLQLLPKLHELTDWAGQILEFQSSRKTTCRPLVSTKETNGSLKGEMHQTADANQTAHAKISAPLKQNCSKPSNRVFDEYLSV